MLNSRLTSSEVNILLYLSHRQSDEGKIYGVYYRDVCSAVHISIDTFYTAIDSLVKKKILRREKPSYGDADLTILGNDFSQPGAYQEGYLNMGHALFSDEAFLSRKAAEKLIAMKFLIVCGASKTGKYWLPMEAFYDNYGERLGVSRRTLRKYLSGLRRFFNVSLTGKVYSITPKKEICYAEKEHIILPSDQELLSEQLMRTACRRNRAAYTAGTYRDTKTLIRQYLAKLRTDMPRVFLNAVADSIRKANETIQNMSKWNRQLNPKFIHKLMLCAVR